MLEIKSATKFKKDLKKFKYRQDVINELNEVIKFLREQKTLDKKYCDHALSGNWKNHRDCHLKPDVVLIYATNEKNLFLERLGSHSDLF